MIMKMLVAVSPEYKLSSESVNTLQEATGATVLVNSLPPEGGIAIYDCGDLTDAMAWADYSVKIGDCQTGRYHFDDTINIVENAAAYIADTWGVEADTVDNND